MTHSFVLLRAPHSCLMLYASGRKLLVEKGELHFFLDLTIFSSIKYTLDCRMWGIRLAKEAEAHQAVFGFEMCYDEENSRVLVEEQKGFFITRRDLDDLDF